MRNRIRLVAAGLGLAFVSCGTPSATRPAPVALRHAVVAAAAPTRSDAEAVVVVTIDGARWQEVFGGTGDELARAAHLPSRTAKALVPTLTRWATEDGASVGAPGHTEIHATGPNFVSLPGYTEILSGRAPTGCQSNQCDDTLEPTLLDEVAAAFPSEEVAVVSSWESIRHAAGATSRMTVSTGRVFANKVPSAWLQAGKDVGPWPGDGEYRPDESTAALALRVLREKRPRAIFIGLGDTDEHAHHGDYAGYLGALSRADAFLASLEDELSRMGTRGERTTVLVMCDHGRGAGFRDHGAAWPESSRVWLVAHGAGIANKGMVDLRREARLADVAPTARALMGLTADDDRRAGEPLSAMLR